jgi:uncharacterized membrane protein YgcG
MRSATSDRRGLFSAILIGLVALVVPVQTARAMPDPRVRDDAGFFSEGAIRQANEMIANIKKDHGKDFYVETHASIPPELRRQFEQQGKDRFFSEWLSRRAREEQVDGIIVLITREPGHLQVGTGKATESQPFIQADRDMLRDTLLEAFRAKEYDRGLDTAARFVATTLDKTVPRGGAGNARAESSRTDAGAGAPASPAPPPQRTPETGRGGWSMGSILCIGAAVVLAFLLFRGFLASRRLAQSGGMGRGYGPETYGQPPQAPGGPYGGHPAGGGGGMGRGLMGGLLGGLLGGYAYDRFARGGQQPPAEGSAMDSTSHADAGHEPPPSSDIGSDFSSSGGDFDSGGGGGDFSGGDGGSSGGDF